ncbi:MAG TPA: NAD(P)/FAD-dependent oxidoreductase [Chroococcales cyanobacterium]
MEKTEILVIGGGPAGLEAAIHAAELGAEVTLIERDPFLGGQLTKQTHMFFGSYEQFAGVRGVDIAEKLKKEIEENPKIKVLLDAVVAGIYPDGVVTVSQKNDFLKFKPRRIIVATGAYEKMLPFPNNDLPGICGAGGVQTLMNLYGVLPGQEIVMVGAGNIGLIVSYQLLQAGAKVKAILEASPNIDGYLVHAAKIRRMGVPILTSHSVKEAYGQDFVEGVVVQKLDEKWSPIPGTEEKISCDVLCLAVGLSPLSEILWQAGCEMKWIPELGGHVAVRDENLLTTVAGLYIAGDVAGVEEASAAMVEGKLAGLAAAESLGYSVDGLFEKKTAALAELAELRAGHAGNKIRGGIDQVERLTRGKVTC